MASETDICNRALQKLGVSRITSLDEDSPEARDCNAAYEFVRDAELRRHPWGFAIKRVTLAPDVESPDFGFNYAFTLPADALRILPDNEVTDWVVENGKLLTNDGDTLKLRYVARITDTGVYDPLFANVLATRLAFELAESITHSTQLKSAIWEEYQENVRQARAVNAFESISQEPPTDSWITARL